MNFTHRRKMSQAVGRPLLPTEFVHHINGNRHDNRLENLRIVTPSEHRLLHLHTKVSRRTVSQEGNAINFQDAQTFLKGLTRQAHAAQQLGVSRERVRQFLLDGRLLSEEVGGVVFVTQESLDRLKAARLKAKEVVQP